MVRHAIAADREGFPLADELRPITARGRKKFRRVAQAFARLREPLGVILSSPLVRAVQTAEILVGERGDEPEVEIAPRLAPDERAGPLVDEVRARPEEALALVGHEPQVSAIAAAVLGHPLGAPFKKGMVLALSLPRAGGRGSFRYALPPGHDKPIRSLEKLAEELGRE